MRTLLLFVAILAASSTVAAQDQEEELPPIRVTGWITWQGAAISLRFSSTRPGRFDHVTPPLLSDDTCLDDGSMTPEERLALVRSVFQTLYQHASERAFAPPGTFPEQVTDDAFWWISNHMPGDVFIFTWPDGSRGFYETAGGPWITAEVGCSP